MSNQSGGTFTPTSDGVKTPKSSLSEKTGTVVRRSNRPKILPLRPGLTRRATQVQKNMNEIIPGISVNKTPMGLEANPENMKIPDNKTDSTPFHSTPATSPNNEKG